jgi:hypothetical protein
VSLWWPGSLGAHPVYAVTASLQADGSAAPPLTASRTVGFRALYLVTANDTDPASLAGVDGSGADTMRFKVNGATYEVWLLPRGGIRVAACASAAAQTRVTRKCEGL